MPTGAVSDIREEWETLVETVNVNAKDLAFLEDFRTELVVELDGLKAAILRQSNLKAQAQQASRDVEGHLKRGQYLATRLKNGIRSVYGTKGEKLTEFGLNPRRNNRTKKTPQEPGPSTTTPTAASKTASTTKE